MFRMMRFKKISTGSVSFKHFYFKILTNNWKSSINLTAALTVDLAVTYVICLY